MTVGWLTYIFFSMQRFSLRITLALVTRTCQRYASKLVLVWHLSHVCMLKQCGILQGGLEFSRVPRLFNVARSFTFMRWHVFVCLCARAHVLVCMCACVRVLHYFLSAEAYSWDINTASSVKFLSARSLDQRVLFRQRMMAALQHSRNKWSALGSRSWL